MTLQQAIKELFDANWNYSQAQQALNQALSLKALSYDLYTDPIRFVYELIQNSDDAYDEFTSKKSMIRIAIVDKSYLIIANYGKPFCERDIRGICSIGCGTKMNDSKKTGYKGLGFKAVFGKADYVLIASKGNYFRFEENAKEFKWNTKWGKDQISWETLHEQKFEYPWQICPIWTESNQIPKSIQQWLFAQPEVVATVVRIKNISETQEAIRILTGQPHLFMFLRNIKDVRFSINSLEETTLNISALKDSSIKVSYSENKKTSHWLLHSCKLNIPDRVLKDTRLPPKSRKDTLVEMTLAAKIDENDKIVPVRGSDSVLFAYLPTKISTYNLPILVNSNFLVNASREHIHVDSLWNQWLFSCIPNETFKWVQALTNMPKWIDKAYDLLPNKISVSDPLAEQYNQSCFENVKKVPFLLSIDKKSLFLDEAIVDITMFSGEDCIGHELIRDYIMHTYTPRRKFARNPFVTNHHRLRNLHITQFTWEHCMEMLQSDYFLSKFNTASNIKFILYLYTQRNSTQIRKRIHELPFLMDQSKCLRQIMTVYFPSRFSSADWLMLDGADAYVHSDVMKWLEDNLPIKQWLRSLGITEKTDMTFVEQFIIPNVRNYINRTNAINTIQRLFILFQNGQLTTQHLLNLRQIKLFTLNESLVPAYQLYFSNDYSPHLPLDSLSLDPALFLHASYLHMIDAISIQQLKCFFLFLGVHESITPITIDDEWYSELVSAYISANTKNLPHYMNYAFKNRMSILYIEHTQTNFQFAIFFWDYVMRYISVNVMNESETILSQRRFLINNLPQWCVRARHCIPTTTGELLPSIQVFSSTLRMIADKYLPVFACDIRNTHIDGWQKFFGFKTELSIDDCFHLLNLIYRHLQNVPFNDEDERRIQLTYTILIQHLSRIDQAHRNGYKIDRPVFLLSTYDNKFMATSELVFSNDNNFILPNRVAQLRINHENSSNVNLDLLLDVFNVRRVQMNDLTLSDDTNAQLARSLQRKLRNIQPYLFSLAEYRNIENHNIDYDFEIFEADCLELCYQKTMPICQRLIYMKNDQLYIKRPWNSNETIKALSDILCKQLKLPPEFEPDLIALLTNESTTFFDDYCSQKNITIQTRSFEDLFSTTKAHEKLAAMIDRDNIKLFTNLRITSTTSPSEVLLYGLEAQESDWSNYVYHFTHLENAAAILRTRALKARSQLSLDQFKDSAAQNVIKATRTEVKNYVRFYFRPLTPTQRCNENLGSTDLIERYGNKLMCPVPIFFCFNLRALLSIKNLQWKVSLGNMASHNTQYDCSRDIVNKFDFQYVYADTRTERGKHSSQQEFLIESELDFNLLTNHDIKLVFQDDNAYESLNAMITNLEYPMYIDVRYFIGYNPRVMLERLKSRKITIYINNEVSKEKDNGKLLVQSVENSRTATITGNLSGIFIRDNVLTILGEERISFVPESDDIKFAVYYKFVKQIWLIYTNYSNPVYKNIETDHNDAPTNTYD